LPNNNQNIIKYPNSSFYWGMRILDKEKRNAMFTVYAFCKKADSIADNQKLKKDKKKKINKLKKEINEIYKNNLNNSFRKNLKHYIDRYKLDKKYFLDIIKGVEMDINNIMICPNRKIFNLYCYRVAGAVGMISLKIFGEYNTKSKKFGLYLANALQITNILRDIKQDANMGRMYIPIEILNKIGIKKNKITFILKNKKFPDACKKMLKYADKNFASAEIYLKNCSKKKLKPAIIMMDTYKLLLKKIKNKGWKNLHERVTLTKLEKFFLLIKGMI